MGMAGRKRKGCSLGPIVPDTFSIPRQTIKAVESVEMIDGNASDRTGFGKPQIHRDAALAPGVCLKRPPKRDAATGRAKVKFNRRAPSICASRTQPCPGQSLNSR